MNPLETLLWIIVSAAALELLIVTAGIVFVGFIFWRATR